MSAAGGNDAILSKALHDLMVYWESTETVWRDKARADFERDHIESLVPAVRAATNAIQDVENALRRIRKECS